MTTKPRRRSAITALFAAAIVFLLALPAFASADPLGSLTLFNEGLRGSAFIFNDTAGPDGNVWFIDNRAASEGIPAIGKITPSGEITEYEPGGAHDLTGLNSESDPIAIAAGPGGTLWFTDRGATPAIGVITPASCTSTCAATEYSTGLNAESIPQGIVAGPGGNLWFADAGTTKAIGKINPTTHAIEEFSVGLNAGSEPHGIVAGPDGNVWFTDTGTTKALGRVTPSGEITEFATGAGSEPGGSASVIGPWGIAAGPDGNVWFTENGINTTNAPNGKAIGRITPSGTITYFSTGLAASSQPIGLTAAPDGKLWFTDMSKVTEKQELTIEAGAENLGGTYKLGYKGQETGWSGKGNISFGSGTGNTSAATGSGKVTTGSKIVKSVSTTTGEYEVGQIITISPTTNPAVPTNTTITKCTPSCAAATELELSSNATGTGSEVSKTLTTGSKTVSGVTTTTGAFAVGQTITGTGIAASTTISACSPSCAAPTSLTLSARATAKGTGVAFTASSKTISGVTTSSGTPSNGEEISGTGIPASTTITECTPSCESPTSLKISSSPTAAGTEVSLSANLPYNADRFTVRGALEKLSGLAESVEVSGGTTTASKATRPIEFVAALEATDVELLSCNGAGLTGTSPSCSVTTTQEAKSNAVDSITTSGTITRYPSSGLNSTGGLNGITAGPDGNLWFPTGIVVFTKIAKFGIEEETGIPLKVIHEGAGGGTIQSSPAGITCTSGECQHKFPEGEAVTLTASPAPGSLFVAWKNCDTGGVHGRQCTVHVTAGHKTVGAKFEPANTVTVKTKGNGTGSVSGVTCGNTCTEAQGIFLASKAVTLKAKPYTKTSEFKGWTASPASCTLSEGGLTCSLGLLSANETVEAEFAEIARENLKVTKTGKGQGAVTSSPAGINCSYTCPSNTAYYYKGTSVTLTASVQEGKGSALGNWGGACSGTEATPCVVSMSEAKEVTAEFK